MSATVVAVAVASTSNNNMQASRLHALNRSTSSSSISSSNSPERMASAHCNAQSNTICRVVAIDDEDSRECPSQGASEIARDDIYHLGIDARGGGVCPAQQTTRHVLYTMYNNNNNSSSSSSLRDSITGTEIYPFSRRVSDHACQRVASSNRNNTAFIERRDCNSFDSIDGT